MSKPFKVLYVLVLFFVLAGDLRAMTSTNYTINWDSVNSGGDDISSSTNYRVRDTLGDQAIGISSSTNYTLYAGYRQGDTVATILTFEVGTQENATEVTYTAFDYSGKTVTVASVAGYSVGNFIGVVENKGLSQMVAIGKISSIVGTTITVDAWDGNPALMSAGPAGGDDVVYRLEGVAAELGSLSTTEGKTSLTHTSVFSNTENGYTVYANSDGALRSGSNTIGDVGDGSVTVGSAEYGGRVVGSSATGTSSDFALTTGLRAIQSSSTFANDERVALVYKVSIASITKNGTYVQQVLYTVTANF